MLTLVIVSFGLLLAGLYVRRSFRERPVPRQVPGERPEETHIMLLAAYRLHTWVLTGNVVLWVPSALARAGGQWMPGWYAAAQAAGWLLLLLTAHRLYWRLGYDGRRWLLLLGYLSPPFWLTEFYGALRPDLIAYLQGREAGGREAQP